MLQATRFVIAILLLASHGVTVCRADCCLDGDVAMNFNQAERLKIISANEPGAFLITGGPSRPERLEFAGRLIEKYCSWVPLGKGRRLEAMPSCVQYKKLDCGGRSMTKFYCKDLELRAGYYCGRGSGCNWFGCNCDGGCIGDGGQFRRLATMSSPASTQEEQENEKENPVGTCQKSVVSLYGTRLQEAAQIQTYFDCLQTKQDGVLDDDDDSVSYLRGLPFQNQTVFDAMDADSSGSIDASEFDSKLPSVTAAVARSATCGCRGHVLPLLLLQVAVLCTGLFST